MRMIDADALIERTEILDDVFVINWTTEKVRGLINAAPTIDAVEVVRCKDCKHLYFKDMSAYCPFKVSACRPNGFCSLGERRNDG